MAELTKLSPTSKKFNTNLKNAMAEPFNPRNANLSNWKLFIFIAEAYFLSSTWWQTKVLRGTINESELKFIGHFLKVGLPML